MSVIIKNAHVINDIQLSHRSTNNKNLVVRCGEWDMSSEFEPLAHQDRDVARVMVHPGFWKGDHLDIQSISWRLESANMKYFYLGNLTHDIALLFTREDEPFELHEHLDTICLPKLQQRFVKLFIMRKASSMD